VARAIGPCLRTILTHLRRQLTRSLCVSVKTHRLEPSRGIGQERFVPSRECQSPDCEWGYEHVAVEPL
jgi:hypothetical protein